MENTEDFPIKPVAEGETIPFLKPHDGLTRIRVVDQRDIAKDVLMVAVSWVIGDHPEAKRYAIGFEIPSERVSAMYSNATRGEYIATLENRLTDQTRKLNDALLELGSLKDRLRETGALAS